MRPTGPILSRREHVVLVASLLCAHPRRVPADDTTLQPPAPPPSLEGGRRGVVSRAGKLPELSRAFAVSRDTNVSPGEIYNFLRYQPDLQPDAILKGGAGAGGGRALDLGAGAGASTQLLWEAGWAEVVAVDPSREAWDKYAPSGGLPRGVSFNQQSDEQYAARWAAERDEPFDLVVLNYAVNREKAVRLARLLLAPTGKLLAPTNISPDYWFQQVYMLFDSRGEPQWTTKATLGSYDILFQPDFTADTCVGQWCPQFRRDEAAAKLELWQGLR